MKVRFQWGMPALSGKAGDIVFCLHKRSGKIYARKRKKPSLSENHHKMGAVARNLFALKPTEAFKNDCRIYADKLGKLSRSRGTENWSNCYIRLMYSLAKARPELDLASLSRAQIYEQDLPCISIKRAVEAGLLVPVRDYERLTALF